MEDYVDSYEPLIIKNNSSSEIEVIDDFNYNLLPRGDFNTGYTQLQQKNFVQLPDGLVKPKKVAKMKFTFTPAKRDEEEDEESQSESEQSPPESQPEKELQPEKESQPETESSSESSSSESSSSDDETLNMPAT